MLSRLFGFGRGKQSPLRCLQCGSDRLRPDVRSRPPGFADEDESDEDGSEYLECATCSYRCAGFFAALDHVRFATAGATICAGQSTWWAVFYRQVVRGESTDLVPLPCLGRSLADTSVSQLESGHQLCGTAPELPTPMSYLVLDGPPRRAVHVSDYAGEVMSQSPSKSAVARLHHSLDGFLLFFDPLGARYGAKLEDQAKHVVEFLRNVRRARGGGPPPPIAVCLPKCDALETETARRFIASVETLPMGSKRSEWCRKFLWAEFPAWRAALTTLSEWSRAAYFPMWMCEPGRSSPRVLGPLRPFGVVEPVGWLLRQTG